MNSILVAYDGTESSKRALATASTMSKALGARLGVVSVVPRVFGRHPIAPWDDGDVHAAQLAEARNLIRADGLEAEAIEALGDPAGMIEQVAERHGYDTIVVGATHPGGLVRFLQGSVSEHVASHASATVIVAR
jgi:nucleotide-binding universal stress UspA family protein